jgi:Fur family ferric uptake transcriptional regulator
MKQIRNTQAKTEILNLINESETALSHHAIQQKVGDLCNRVTIYRILDRLEEEGKIHKIVNVDGVVNYARCNHCGQNSHSHDHIHFNCEKCRSVTCIESIVPEISLPENFIANTYNFVISGICPQCIVTEIK